MADDYGSELAGLTYPSVLSRMGVDDPDEVRGDKGKMADLMSRLQGSGVRDQGSVKPQLVAQNQVPPKPGSDPTMPTPQDDLPNPVLRSRPDPAAKPPAPNVPAVSPQGTDQPNATDAAALAKGWQQDAARRAVMGTLDITDQARQNYATEPEPPDTTQVDQRIEGESTPTQLHDQSGKTLKQYRTGFLGELGRIGHNALAGASGDMSKVQSYGAPNKQYAEDEELRQQNLALDEMRKKDVLDRFKTNLAQRKEQAKDLMSVYPGYKDAGTMAIDAQRSQSQQDKDADEAKRQSPQGQADAKTAVSEAEFKQLGSEADRLGLTGARRVDYIGNKGKMTDPRQPSAEEIARAQASRTWEREHPGETPTLEDINQINAAAGGRLHDPGNQDDAVGAIVGGATGKKNEFISNYDRQPDGTYLRKGAVRYGQRKEGDVLTGQQYGDKVEQFRLDANKDLVKHGAEIDAQGNVVRKSGRTAAGTTGGAGASPASVDQVQVGQVYKGHKYLGGDKTNPKSWQKVKR